MLLLNLTIFRSSFFVKYFLGSYIPVLSEIVGQFLWFYLLWFNEGLWFIYCSNFWSFFSLLLPFFSISNNNFLMFLTETGDFSSNSSEMLLHFRFPTLKWWVYQQTNAFKLTGIVYYNCSSLMILVNDPKNIQLVSTLNFFKPFHIASIKHP